MTSKSGLSDHSASTNPRSSQFDLSSSSTDLPSTSTDLQSSKTDSRSSKTDVSVSLPAPKAKKSATQAGKITTAVNDAVVAATGKDLEVLKRVHRVTTRAYLEGKLKKKVGHNTEGDERFERALERELRKSGCEGVIGRYERANPGGTKSFKGLAEAAWEEQWKGGHKATGSGATSGWEPKIVMPSKWQTGE